MSGRKTVLIVDDDPGILRVLSDGLSSALDMFDVVTAGNGLEAVQELERRSIDVLVTDLAMPVMDGFALIAYVTNQRSTLPVVVLSGMVGSMLDQRLAGYGGLRVLRKPASYQEVAACVLDEIERVDRGLIEGIPLSGVLQLIEAERRSCKVVVTSGRRRGELDFESGRLVNAFSDDFGAEGEAAAYDVLGWPDTAIELAPLPTTVRRLIHTPMQLLLVEVAAAQDRGDEHGAGDPPTAEGPATADADEPHTGPFDGADGPPFDGADDGHADAQPGNPPEGPNEVPADARAPEPEVEPDDAHVEPPEAPPVAASDDGPAAIPAHAPVAAASAAVDEAEQVDDSILLDEPPAPAALAAASPEESIGSTASAPLAGLFAPDGEAARPAAPAPAATPDTPAKATSSTPDAPDGHVRDMLAAIERLAERAKAADDALAAVAVEIEAFREAQRRFDEANAQREQRRRDLERFRDEVAHLAREILGRVDGLFDAMASDPAPGALGEERPAT
ncbi:MAG: response regulator [Trueperaceae bacterium]|nr:response regulator [Trueperaceae bacterium]